MTTVSSIDTDTCRDLPTDGYRGVCQAFHRVVGATSCCQHAPRFVLVRVFGYERAIGPPRPKSGLELAVRHVLGPPSSAIGTHGLAGNWYGGLSSQTSTPPTRGLR